MGCTKVSLMMDLYFSDYLLGFLFVVWAEWPFLCVLASMYMSELEIAPYIIRTLLFHLNRLWAPAFICRHLLNILYCIYLLFKASINIHQLIPHQPPSGPPSSTTTCHDSLILVHNHLTFSPYLPSLYLLIPQAKYFFAIHIDSWTLPLSTLPINLFISSLLYHQYLLWGTLQCLSSVPETSEICFQGWVAFHLTLTTLNAGSNILNQGSTQVGICIASIMYALNLLLDQPSHSCKISYIL